MALLEMSISNGLFILHSEKQSNHQIHSSLRLLQPSVNQLVSGSKLAVSEVSRVNFYSLQVDISAPLHLKHFSRIAQCQRCFPAAPVHWKLGSHEPEVESQS